MCLIIEIKNIAGTLYFDPIFKQLIRTKGGEEIGFRYPITQLERQETLLKKWLQLHQLPKIPIYSLVVISNPQSIIRTSPSNDKLSNKVIHSEILPTKINQIENSINNQFLLEKEIKKVIRLLLKHHTPAYYPLLKQYEFSKEDLIKGVICEKCNHRPLERVHGNWYCPQCQSKNKTAHIQALKDYQWLIGSTITNNELRDFLKVESQSCATRLISIT